MNILILGDGPEELAWAYALREHPQHRLAAACPGFKSMPDVPGGNDLDAALAINGLDAVICGGDPALRSEGLRRAASTGMRAIALHPPGPNADPYYQVALSRQENGAIVVPDLPARLHPGVATLEKALNEGKPNANRTVRYELEVGPDPDPSRGDLVGWVLPRVLDVVRALIGEIQAVTATGIPAGDHPTDSLVVQLRGAGGLQGEIRISAGPNERASLSVSSGASPLALDHDLDFRGPSRLIRGSFHDPHGVSAIELGTWDAKSAILRVLEDASPDHEPSPGLTDGTRAMEVAEAAARSLRRGRTIDLYYEEMSEVGNFKSVMTSVGCGLLLGTMFLMFAVAAAKSLGLDWAVYVAWIIPPVLVLFILFQFLRYAIKT